ncbi:MAG: SsrA-binding protein SmpB [Candidatus Omnitrophica bacterium]|nr:SsrA-binding protein SmpB [Candidatus Omnitrophota bacterium]
MCYTKDVGDGNAGIIATNREAGRDYHIIESYESGIELKGSEVKSLREGRVSLKESFGRIEKDEIFLYNLHIPPYSHGNINNPDAKRKRKLLLHRAEIRKLTGRISEKGFTLIPLKMYFKKGFVKVEVALAKGKKLYDKREVIKKKTAERELRRAFKNIR